MDRVLIIGGFGQDGIILSKLLVEDGFQVTITSRRPLDKHRAETKILNVDRLIKTVCLDPLNFSEILNAIKEIKPTLIFNFSAQTSVGKSFLYPSDTYESSINTMINILEAIRQYDKRIKIFHASSIECFGENPVEDNLVIPRFNPISPYASAKCVASDILKSYREIYGLYAINGFLTNHESTLRNENFVIAKIFRQSFNIHKKQQKKIILGDISVQRDWGYAAEYMFAIKEMMKRQKADDFILGTGQTMVLENFVKRAFEFYDLELEDFLEIDDRLSRKNELQITRGTTSFVKQHINWEPNYFGLGLVDKLSEDFHDVLRNE